MAIVLFVILLTFLILIHELGHFFVAKWAKVHIEEFGIGLPPKILTLFTWKGIPFTLNWGFLGGFVRMEGEDPASEAGKSPKSKVQSPKSSVFPFYTRPLLQKLAVVIAGPFVNFAFGVLVFSTLFSMYGIPEKVYTSPVLQEVTAGTPAQTAGLQAGDMIVSAKTESSAQFFALHSNQQFIEFINSNRGKDLTFHVKRKGQELTFPVHARKAEETPEGQGATGILLASQYQIKTYPLWERPFRATLAGLQQSLDFGVAILSSLGSVGRTIASGSVPKDLSGPVGIANQVQKEGVFTNGAVSALNFAALLSINLAIMNLLPIPALDGGRAVLLIIEKFIKGKRFQDISSWLNTAGFVLLLSLLLLITLKDVVGIVFAK